MAWHRVGAQVFIEQMIYKSKAQNLKKNAPGVRVGNRKCSCHPGVGKPLGFCKKFEARSRWPCCGGPFSRADSMMQIKYSVGTFYVPFFPGYWRNGRNMRCHLIKLSI
jgi:hypothetical protein